MTDIVCLVIGALAVAAIGIAIYSGCEYTKLDRLYRRERALSVDLNREIHELSARLDEANRDLAQWRKTSREDG